jgi:hypothetical protein
MRFNGQVIHFLGQDEAAIAIFVGATVETFGGMAPSPFILVFKVETWGILHALIILSFFSM